MAFPYFELFGILLLGYIAYSFWHRLDPRYLIVAALALLVVAAIVAAGGAASVANTLAEYLFLLLGGGVILLLLEQVRPRIRSPAPDSVGGRAPPEDESTDPSDQGERPPQQPLDHLQEEPVPAVDAPGPEHHDHE
jgi:hypothetical protein